MCSSVKPLELSKIELAKVPEPHTEAPQGKALPLVTKGSRTASERQCRTRDTQSAQSGKTRQTLVTAHISRCTLRLSSFAFGVGVGCLGGCVSRSVTSSLTIVRFWSLMACRISGGAISGCGIGPKSLLVPHTPRAHHTTLRHTTPLHQHRTTHDNRRCESGACRCSGSGTCVRGAPCCIFSRCWLRSAKSMSNRAIAGATPAMLARRLPGWGGSHG